MAAKGRNRKDRSQQLSRHIKSEIKVQEKVGGDESWAAGVRSLFSCKDLPQQERRNAHKNVGRKQRIMKKRDDDDDKLKKEQQIIKSKKARSSSSSSSSSCCSNTKVKMQIRPHHHHHQTYSSSSPHEEAAKVLHSHIDASSNCRSIVHKYYSKSFSSTSFNNSVSNSRLMNAKSPPPPTITKSHIPNLRKLSGGCYQCKMVLDPVVTFSCPHCSHVFMKADNLEIHLALSHAVTELGRDDTSKNVVEIIFQSSWLKKEVPVCKIDRILKVQNTQKTISRFEKYRETVKAKASHKQQGKKDDPRCVADGNELLRFHCTSLKCCLGLNGSSNLCNSIPTCGVCSIIKNGFKLLTSSTYSKGAGSILTTATSGKAHDNASANNSMRKRAMLVCRVIAGRVKIMKNTTNCKNMNIEEEYESVGLCNCNNNNLDELHVFNPSSILPCFVVIYAD